MRKLTRLLSGTAASAALLSAPAMAEGADIASHLSQPIYIVDQYLYEDVHASIITDIEDYSAEVSSNVIGLGNTASAWVENGDLNSVMSQTLGATVTAENLIDGGTAGHVSASTLAYGNSGSSGTIWGANQHFANQIAYADIEAHAHIDMQGAYTIASTSSAIANVSASMIIESVPEGPGAVPGATDKVTVAVESLPLVRPPTGGNAKPTCHPSGSVPKDQVNNKSTLPILSRVISANP